MVEGVPLLESPADAPQAREGAFTGGAIFDIV